MDPYDLERNRHTYVSLTWKLLAGIAGLMTIVGILIGIEAGFSIGNVTTSVVCLVPAAILFLLAGLIYYFLDYRQWRS